MNHEAHDTNKQFPSMKRFHATFCSIQRKFNFSWNAFLPIIFLRIKQYEIYYTAQKSTTI